MGAPAAPSGQVTVVGRVAPPEGRPRPVGHLDGALEVRRIVPAQLAAELPYPLFGSYLLLDAGQPGSDGVAEVPSPRENAWQNAGYTVQWWLFAALTLVGFGWLARREAHGPPPAAGEDRAAPGARVPT
jgi:cytochrome oxidase assembly protein ShyY1